MTLEGRVISFFRVVSTGTYIVRSTADWHRTSNGNPSRSQSAIPPLSTATSVNPFSKEKAPPVCCAILRNRQLSAVCPKAENGNPTSGYRLHKKNLLYRQKLSCQFQNLPVYQPGQLHFRWLVGCLTGREKNYFSDFLILYFQPLIHYYDNLNLLQSIFL